MTHRPLYDNELFEIRIDRLVDKWSGSIEVSSLVFECHFYPKLYVGNPYQFILMKITQFRRILYY